MPSLAARSLMVALLGFLIGLALAALVVPIAAQADAADPPKRVESVVVYGNDPCPKQNPDEIVVCARQPESERYRIPERFRGQKRQESPASNAWANKVRANEESSRVAGGLPNTCSAFGTGGQTGCFDQMQNQYHAERQQQKQEAEDASEPDGGGPN